MTPLKDFKEILVTKGISIPEESLEFFRDLMDIQADLILDDWIRSKSAHDKL